MKDVLSIVECEVCGGPCVQRWNMSSTSPPSPGHWRHRDPGVCRDYLALARRKAEREAEKAAEEARKFPPIHWSPV